jgi:LPS sulfotransferase NodH
MLKHNLLRKHDRPEGWRLALRRWKHGLKLSRRYWLARHRPYVPLFVLATYRSGSNLLVDYLRSLPGVQCYAEVLSPRLEIGPSRGDLSPKQALRHIRYSLQSPKTPVRGCKLMLDQLSGCRLTPDDLIDAFPDGRYIVLYRESLAEQLLSIRTAQATNQWIVRRGQAARTAKVRIEPLELRWYCDEIRRLYAPIVASTRLPERGILLGYNELTGDLERAFAERICPLLDMPYSEPRSSLTKQNRQPLAERIENYDEIASLFHSPQCRQRLDWGQPRGSARAA